MQNNIHLAKKWQMSSVEDLLCDFSHFLQEKSSWAQLLISWNPQSMGSIAATLGKHWKTG